MQETNRSRVTHLLVNLFSNFFHTGKFCDTSSEIRSSSKLRSDSFHTVVFCDTSSEIRPSPNLYWRMLHVAALCDTSREIRSRSFCNTSSEIRALQICIRENATYGSALQHLKRNTFIVKFTKENAKYGRILRHLKRNTPISKLIKEIVDPAFQESVFLSNRRVTK